MFSSIIKSVNSNSNEVQSVQDVNEGTNKGSNPTMAQRAQINNSFIARSLVPTSIKKSNAR